jgi:hypothetical protein
MIPCYSQMFNCEYREKCYLVPKTEREFICVNGLEIIKYGLKQ